MPGERPATPEMYQVSKYHDALLFSDAITDNIAFYQRDLGRYALEARVAYNGAHEDPWVLSVHGARSDFTVSDEVTRRLQEGDFSILAMTMSHHSDAIPEVAKDTCLQDNIDEVEAFFGDLIAARPKIVIAYSLGGTPALKLLEQHSDEIDKLVLFYPGIYDTAAYNQPYGEAFKAAITQPYSYRNTDVITLLERFQGDLLLVKGEYDGLDPEAYDGVAGGSAGYIVVDGKTYYSPIPKEVLDMVYGAVPEERRQLIEVPDCGHTVTTWMRDHPAEADQIVATIQTFLNE